MIQNLIAGLKVLLVKFPYILNFLNLNFHPWLNDDNGSEEHGMARVF